MQTFVLNDQTATMPIQGLIQKASTGGLAVCDQQGKLLAYVVSPQDREAMAYLDAYRDYEAHRGEIEAALKRRGGVTTKELLEKAQHSTRDVA